MEDKDTKPENPYKDMPNLDFDAAVTDMQDNIQKEIAESCRLIGDKLDVMTLTSEYNDDDVYKQKIKQMNQLFSHIRRTRGDGNCFYRSFGFGYLEYLCQNPDYFSSFKKRLEAAQSCLKSLGYETFTVEDFYEQFVEVVNEIESSLSIEKLLENFCDDGISNYLVVFLRLVTSGYLQENAEFYQHFMENNATVQEFCKMEVEPMAKESDHIHIIAISSALNVSVKVAYLDRGDEMTYHNFPEDSQAQIHLLYRPGHYDILYKR